MGLDNYWRTEDGQPATIEGNFRICGGICSGNGHDSFRGQVYSSVVEAITGISLYEDNLEPHVIDDMNDKIQECPYDEAKNYSQYGLSEEEWKDFKTMWDAHARAGHSLTSWW
jgi:hypothetical protein